MSINMTLKLFAILAISFSVMTISVYAEQTITDRVEIDNDDIGADINVGDLFGYEIEAIGDLNGDGVIDLATIKFSDDSGEVNAGSILILFMNNDGSVLNTHEITMEDNFTDGIGNVCLNDVGTQRGFLSLEQLAFVGDLDNDGEPTLAVGAAGSYPDGALSDGAVYMLELNSDGTVDNCLEIIPGQNGFAPADEYYLNDGDAFFGWPLIATDLNGDGQNELIAGASNGNDDLDVEDSTTNLWVFFLSSTGAVASHPATPILGVTDLGITEGIVNRDYISDGDTIDGGTKIVIGVTTGGIVEGVNSGAIHIINLTSEGAFSSSTQITGPSLGQGISGNAEAFGRGVAAIGDIDGDGVEDIMVGNESGDDTNINSGEAYILYLNDDDTVKESQKISNESEDTRNGTTPFAGGDFFGNGITLWKTGGGEIVVAISAHADDTGGNDSGAIHLFTINVTAPSSNGGGDNDLSRPTFGLDHHTFVQRVDSGLVINGQAFTVDNNFFTHIPMQNMTVGQVQNFTATVYAPHQLYVMEFLFGIPEVGKWNDAEASLALYFDYAGKLIDVVPKNVDDTIANFDVLKYSYGKTLCVPDDNTEFCDRVSIEFVFNEAPLGNVLALQAIDLTRRSTILYFNDGLDIQGDSLNPPVLKEILSPLKGKGTQTVERIDKANDIWKTLDEDEQIVLYQQNSVGSFIPMERKTFERFTDSEVSVMTRLHSGFGGMMSDERDRASQIFDSSQIQSTVGDSYTYDYSLKTERILKIYELIEEEMIRATETFNLKYTDNERN